jgi:hypothetical protein
MSNRTPIDTYNALKAKGWLHPVEAERLTRERDEYRQSWSSCCEVVKKVTRERDEAQREVGEWRACAVYDVKMNGLVPMSWNRSALERCREKYVNPTVNLAIGTGEGGAS